MYSVHACMCAKPLQSYLILCDPMECTPAGSSVHGNLQTRIIYIHIYSIIVYKLATSNARVYAETQISCIHTSILTYTQV